MRSKGLRRGTALAGCALMGGCALLNPYVKVDNVHVAEAPAGASDWARSRNLLKLEHDSAQAQADTYRKAAIAHAKLKTGLAVTQVPLNAAIVAAAATNDRSDFPLIGGITSAAALGLGGLLSSPARQAIYLQAQTATLCAMAAYDVYFVSQSDYDKYLTSAPTALQADVLAVAKARNELKDALAIYDAGTPDAAAKATADEAKEIAAAAAAAKAKAERAARVRAAAAARAAANAKAAAAAKAKPKAAEAPSASKNAAPAADVVYTGPARNPTPLRRVAIAQATTADAPPVPPPQAQPAKPPAAAAAPPAAPRATTAGDRLETYATAIHDLATAALTRASEEITAGTATVTSLQDVRGRVDEAGRMLGDRRMAIKTQVDQNIQTTELTFDQIKAAISASALASTQPTPTPPPAATDEKPEGTAAAQALTPRISARDAEEQRSRPVIQAMTNLDAALGTLNLKKAEPDGWLRRELAKERTATQVGTCTASAHVVLTATPDNPAQVSPGKPLKIQIHAPEVGGAPTFTKLEEGLTATMTTGGGYDYTLTIAQPDAAKPTSKDQTVVISSGTQSVKVAFTVPGASGGGGGAKAEAPTASDKQPPKAG